MKCSMCPRRCGVERGETIAEGGGGFCAEPFLPVVARAGLHHWEEPVISGTRGSGAVFFSGCNLRCVFCQNYEISNLNAGCQVSVERLRGIYSDLISKGAHNLNLVTPGHFTDSICASLEPHPEVPVVYNTNGYDSISALRRFEGKADIYLPDLKYADDELGKRYSAVADYFSVAAAAIKEMYRQTGPFVIGVDGLMRSGVIIRHLLLPGKIENTRRVIEWVASNFKPGEVMFSLMRQYVPCGRISDADFPELNRRISDREYRRAKEIMLSSGIADGFVQSAAAAATEFIPSFDGTGVLPRGDL